MENNENIQILAEFEDVLTFAELKNALRLSRNKCYDLLQKGTIKSIKIGTDYRILKANVIKYLQGIPQ